MAEDNPKPPSSEDRIRQARERLDRDREERSSSADSDAEHSDHDPGRGDPAEPSIPDRPDLTEEPGPDRVEPKPSVPEAGRGVGDRLPSEPVGTSAGSGKRWYERRWVRGLGFGAVIVTYALFNSGLFDSELALEAGDCFNSPELVSGVGQVELLDVDLVPCDEPHSFETFGLVEYRPATGAFPGDSALANFAGAECVLELERYIDGDALNSGFDVVGIVPNADGWRAGDRTIDCALTRLDEQMATGSAQGAGSVVPEGYVSVFRLREGDCLNATDWIAFGTTLTCDDPHDFEVFAVLTNPDPLGAPYSSVEEVSQAVANRCRLEFLSRVDPAVQADLEFFPLALPLPNTWVLGHRTSVCALVAADSGKLEGSRLSAHRRFDDLSSIEFGAGLSLVDFDGFSDVDSFDLVGSAHQQNEVLAITAFAEHALRGVPFEQERSQRGAAWFSEAVPVESGFVTAFVFQFEMYSWFTVGDGLAFVIQGGGTTALGDEIGYDGMPNSLAIEFDTLRQDFLADPANNIPDAPNLLANHVSVHTGGVEANDIHGRASLGSANLEATVLADRAAHVALIRYEPGEMTIYVDDFDTPALTVSVDLAETLFLPGGSAHVGFTASSGPRITGHKILAWKLTPSG